MVILSVKMLQMHQNDLLIVSGLFFGPNAPVTCSWSDQPAVEEAPSHRIVEDQSPLTVHRLHHVLHGDWDVGVRARRVLVALLPLNEEVSEGACSSSLRYGQCLIVPACDIKHSDVINIEFISEFSQTSGDYLCIAANKQRERVCEDEREK